MSDFITTPIDKILELKSIVKEIEAIEYIIPAFSLTFEEQTRLDNIRNEINLLIKKL